MVYSNLHKIAEYYLKLAVLVDTTNIRSLHDKELREAVGKKKVLVYHGTSSKNLSKIIEHGYLDPSKAEKTWEVVTPGIYVTRQLAGFTGAWLYANHVSQIDKSDPVVMELVIPLNWIEIDPDDTRYSEMGEMEDLGENQGVVKRTISIKNIKSVCFQGEKIGKIKPGYQSDIFDRNKTEWMPLGTALRLINKKKAELPPEYANMVENIPKGLSKSQIVEDPENLYAGALDVLYTTSGGSPTDTFEGKRLIEKALIWLLNNKNVIWQSARKGLESFGKYLGIDFLGDIEHNLPTEYHPKPFENLGIYLKRVK